MSNQVLLHESQNLDFDRFYINETEFQQVLEHISGSREPQRIADFGGGNGVFCDLLIRSLVRSMVTNIDISQALLARNSGHPRKTIVHSSFLDHVPSKPYNVIFLNYVLHHLVATTSAGSRKLIQDALHQCHRVLEDDGTLVIFENILVGLVDDRLATSLLFHGTSSRSIAWVTKRLGANTAGVGVYYMGEAEFTGFIREAGFHIAACIDVRPRKRKLNLLPALAKEVRRIGYIVRKS